MNASRIYKTLAFSALIAEFVIFFMLFGMIRNLIIELNPSANQKMIYVFLILAVVILVFLFIISIIVTNKSVSNEKYANKGVAFLEDNTKQNSVEDDQNKEDLLDVEYYIKKIIPKEDSKLTLVKYTEKILSNLAKEFDIVQGLFFVKEKESVSFNIAGKYAYFGDEEPKSFNLGETLSGQVAKNKTTLNLKEIPDNYVTILSGLGSSSPNQLIIIPIVLEDNTVAIIELASFKKFKQNFSDLFEGMSEQIGKALLKY